MANEPDPERLKALGERLAAKRKTEAPRPKAEDHHSAAQLAWRMVIELVAGIAIGFGIGYGLDSWLGTMPLFLVLFVLLGFAAGVRTMLRSAEEAREREAGPEGPGREE